MFGRSLRVGRLTDIGSEMESKCEDKASIQLMRLILTGKRMCSEIGKQYLSKNNMTSCRRTYSVTNVGVR